jgi:hypothetical protein
MMDYAKGSPLIQSADWLRDDAERIERILEVTEINSVIEGLPELSEATRRRIRDRLKSLSSHWPGHPE